MPPQKPLEITLSDLAIVEGTSDCTATFTKTDGTGNVTVDDEGNISFAGNSDAVNINWTLDSDSTNAGWNFSTNSPFTYEVGVFYNQPSNGTTVTVTNEVNAWKYTLHLTKDGSNYVIDPRVVNR